MQFAIGMMAALAAREQTGEGQVVDTCLLNASLTLHHQEATAYLNTGRLYPRAPFGIAHAHNTPLYARYQCADERWLVLIGEFYITEPWQRLSRALDLDAEMADDPRFATVDGIEVNAEAAHHALRDAFGRIDRDEALRRLEAQDVLAAPVNAYPEVFEDPQLRHNGMVMEAARPEIGPFRLVGPPIKLSATPVTLRNPPPTVGEHNRSVLAAHGFGPEEIDRLRDEGVIGSEVERQQEDGTVAWGSDPDLRETKA
jgi:formyl-CoA transferase